MKFGLIIAARFGSRRLPGKAMLPLNGIPVLEWIIKRLKPSKLMDTIILATTLKKEDDVIARLGKNEAIQVFRGPEDDVLGRYAAASMLGDFNNVVRVTGDCPFISAESLDSVIEECSAFGDFDLITTKPYYPSGIDYEICKKEVLLDINQRDLSSEDREHIFNFLYRNDKEFSIKKLIPEDRLKCSDDIFLLDTPIDYERIQTMIRNYGLEITPEQLIGDHKLLQEIEGRPES